MYGNYTDIKSLDKTKYFLLCQFVLLEGNYVLSIYNWETSE